MFSLEKKTFNPCKNYSILSIYDDILRFYNCSILIVPLFRIGYYKSLYNRNNRNKDCIGCVNPVISPMETNDGILQWQ